ncbi:microcin-processing peptidase 1. Unknown type peptidase. MEROPS family U62 [Kushneria avicenniae]|uniref:PmbA protein n=1 Tax=Kushneria avicenniae TaxID=402385 RepID=A0A1I1M7T2_9GAMM|nr:metalloprotease PmbA [Kushneria avicenniae]SFC81451.1 microcin-processing peptidase 1. Unknown type peptidase. MEROPS family U62 [Kushneria avicenniae]
MASTLDIDDQQRSLEAAVSQALEYARTAGADACEIGASVQQGMEINVRQGSVETLEMARDQGIGVTLYLGQRRASVSSSDASHASLVDAVNRALDIARYTGEDPAAGLADPALLARELPDMGGHHPWALAPDEGIELARRCEQGGLAVEGIDSSDGASLTTSEGVSVYGNSHGFMGVTRASHHALSCMMIARDGSGMQRDHDYTVSCDAARLREPEAVGRVAAEQAMARLGAQTMDTGRMPVIFTPNMARSLIGHLLNAIAGGAIFRDASFLCEAMGERLFPEWLSLGERPREYGALASSAYDDDGVYTRDNEFIREGRLTSWMLSTYSARRLGLVTTGNAGGARNVRLQAPLTPEKELLGSVERGVMVTELMGQGVNTVTGDYSRGAAGFLIEKGKIVAPVEEFTIAGNLRDMFHNLVALGDDVDRRSSVHTGSWLIDDMMIAG